MIILLDNGHGEETKGKRSPDETLLEYKYTRDITKRILGELQLKGYVCYRIVPEESDISLTERCSRVNEYCKQYGKDNVLLVSVHNNAAGKGEWMKTRGWSIWVYKGVFGVSKHSKLLAECIHDAAKEENLKILHYKPTQKYWTCGFKILRSTQCPAVLTENMFQDNKDDVKWLLSEKGKKAIVNLHVNGIIDYINKLQKEDNDINNKK